MHVNIGLGKLAKEQPQHAAETWATQYPLHPSPAGHVMSKSIWTQGLCVTARGVPVVFQPKALVLVILGLASYTCKRQKKQAFKSCLDTQKEDLHPKQKIICFKSYSANTRPEITNLLKIGKCVGEGCRCPCQVRSKSLVCIPFHAALESWPLCNVFQDIK